jgi:hypothetical protein
MAPRQTDTSDSDGIGPVFGLAESMPVPRVAFYPTTLMRAMSKAK